MYETAGREMKQERQGVTRRIGDTEASGFRKRGESSTGGVAAREEGARERAPDAGRYPERGQ